MGAGVRVGVGVGGTADGVEVGGANVGIGSIVSLLVQAVKDESPKIKIMSPTSRLCFDLIMSTPSKFGQRVLSAMLWLWRVA